MLQHCNIRPVSVKVGGRSAAHRELSRAFEVLHKEGEENSGYPVLQRDDASPCREVTSTIPIGFRLHYIVLKSARLQKSLPSDIAAVRQ